MFCFKCGKEHPDTANFCSGCGVDLKPDKNTQTFNNGYTIPQRIIVEKSAPKYNGLALAGFIVALSSLLLNFFGLVGLTALVLSLVGYNQLRENDREKGLGFAYTGITVGAFSVAYGIVTLIFFILYINGVL